MKSWESVQFLDSFWSIKGSKGCWIILSFPVSFSDGASKNSRVDSHFCFRAQASNHSGLTMRRLGMDAAASYLSPSGTLDMRWVFTDESRFLVYLFVYSFCVVPSQKCRWMSEVKTMTFWSTTLPFLSKNTHRPPRLSIISWYLSFSSGVNPVRQITGALLVFSPSGVSALGRRCWFDCESFRPATWRILRFLLLPSNASISFLLRIIPRSIYFWWICVSSFRLLWHVPLSCHFLVRG